MAELYQAGETAIPLASWFRVLQTTQQMHPAIAKVSATAIPITETGKKIVADELDRPRH